MATGIVKWWNKEKGFGFITSTSGEDVLVVSEDIQTEGFPSLEDGALVEFERTITNRGNPRAQNVREPGEPLDSSLLERHLPNPFIQTFSASSVRELEYEANERALTMGLTIRSVSVTTALDDEGYLMTVVFEE